MNSVNRDPFKTPECQSSTPQSPPPTPHPKLEEPDCSRLHLPEVQLPTLPVESNDQVVVDVKALPKLLLRSIRTDQR